MTLVMLPHTNNAHITHHLSYADGMKVLRSAVRSYCVNRWPNVMLTLHCDSAKVPSNAHRFIVWRTGQDSNR
jgi:hypothetical protein